MLSYLLRGQASRALFRLLWSSSDPPSGNAHQLAQLAGVPYRDAAKELRLMVENGLAVARPVGGQTLYEPNRATPAAPHLRALAALDQRVPYASVEPPPPAPTGPSFAARLRALLTTLGAPLVAESGVAPAEMPLDAALVEGVRLAHKDASVARALPVVVARNRMALDPAKLAAHAHGRERNAVGFFLDATGELTGDARLRAMAAGLRDKRVRGAEPFFEMDARSRRSRQLAEARTPQLARDWGWTMNMSMDSLRSQLEKHR